MKAKRASTLTTSAPLDESSATATISYCTQKTAASRRAENTERESTNTMSGALDGNANKATRNSCTQRDANP